MHCTIVPLSLHYCLWFYRWERIGNAHFPFDNTLHHIYIVVMNNVTFEWDKSKNLANQRKHKVSFEEARSVFFDENAIEFYDDEYDDSEERFLILGISAKMRILMVCHCLRQNETVLRIISARKATKNEQQQYPWWLKWKKNMTFQN